MSRPVFISYARKTSREQAEALHRALGGEEGLAFLDTSDVEFEERFQARLADALLASQVVVIFADEEYFQRRYCLWELEAALGGSSVSGSGAMNVALEPMLASIVVALSSQASTPELLSLPPGLQERNWPKADDVEALVTLVRRRLAGSPRTLAERLDAAGLSSAVLRTRLLEQIALPPPKNLSTVRMYPRAMPPSLGKSFVGRADDLWRIHYTLSVMRDERGTGAAGAALTGALQGTGGFGKTRLALEYLYRFGPSHYPGGVFWVNADVAPERLEEQFHGILRTLRPEVPDLVEFRKSERDATREMVEALESHAARERILYVVDNVPEPGPDEAPKSLATWCPVIGKVSLLATSRVRLDMGTEGVHALPVLVLEPEAAVALLMDGLTRGRLDDSKWRQIAEWVGRLPLALELLNRALRAGALTPEELLSRAEQRGPAGELERQMDVLRRYVPPGALRGVTETFSISYARLSEAEQFTARLIAHLAPEPIPLRLLEESEPDVTSDELRAIRATLLLRHFVTAVEMTDEVSLLGSMHRLLADWLRSLSPSSTAELWRACRGILRLMNSDAYEDPNEWPLLNACLPHAEIVFERVMEFDSPPGRTRGVDEVLLGMSIGNFLLAKGDAVRASKLAERVVERAVVALGSEHPGTLISRSNLASALYEQGDLKGARTLLEQVLETSLRTLGEEHQSTLTTMHNLASILGAQGDLESALAMEERVLVARQRILGEGDPETLSSMGTIAGIFHAKGDLKRARTLEERVLDVNRSIRGDEHPSTLRAMNNLAGTLRELGELAAARVLDEQVLDARLRVLGEEHPETLSSINNLAATLYVQGDFKRARALQEQVLELGRRVLGEAHPTTLRFMGNLASTLGELGELEGSRALQERALDAMRRILGEVHPDTLMTMRKLAALLRMLGSHDEAGALEERALELVRRKQAR